jgi:hypothetical protein
VTGSVRSVSDDERRGRLGRRHHLAHRTSDVVTAGTDIAGLHATDPGSVYLAARARVRGFEVADLERALYDDRRLLRVLGMRRTMFVVDVAMAAAMNVACVRTIRDREWRSLGKLLTEQGITADPETWLQEVAEATLAALRARGEATAGELREDVPELTETLVFGEGRRWAGSVGLSTRVLFLLSVDGKIVRGRPQGSWLSSQYRWAPTDEWLGGQPHEPEPAEAEQHIATAWLRAFGPGTERDLAWWTGWGVRRTRRALAEIGAVEVRTAAGEAFVLPDDADEVTAPEPWVALLPALDPTTMGWKDRDWYLSGHATSLFDRNGNAGPTIWADGRIVGGWAQRPEGEIAYRLLADMGSEAATRIDAAAEELTGWLGEARVAPRFRTPLERELSG